MSTHGSAGSRLSLGAPAAPEVEGHWAPNGAVLTACVVGINVLVILLIFGFFWRFFSGKGGPSSSSSSDGVGDEDDDSLPVASPWASRHRWRTTKTQVVEDVASSLPVSVYSSAGAGEEGGNKARPECAVCIVELRDGDPVRVLPRCGHRFHADCVGAWLRLHATCPLCRGTVVAPADAAVAGEPRTTTTASPGIVPCEAVVHGGDQAKWWTTT